MVPKHKIIENCNSNTNTVKAHGWEEKGGGSGKYPYAESTYEGAGYDFSKNESDVVVFNAKDGHGVRKINVAGGDKVQIFILCLLFSFFIGPFSLTPTFFCERMYLKMRSRIRLSMVVALLRIFSL